MQLLIYRLLDPDVVTPHHAALEKQILSALRGVRLVEPVFVASPVGAGFSYVDEGRIWRGASPARLARSAHDAALAAKAFMLAINAAAVDYRARLRLTTGEYPDPFPVPLLRHMASRLIFAPRIEQPDHWVSYWMLFLPGHAGPRGAATSSGRAPVHGGVVEVRLGNDNQVIGVSSALRGWRGTMREDAFPPPGSHNGANHVESLIYLMEAASEPQARLVPFYRVDEPVGDIHVHGLAVRPASAQSLLVDIAVELLEEGVRLRPFIMNPEGEMSAASRSNHSIQWAHARLDEMAEGELIDVASYDLRLMEPGIYHVELSVEHRRSGSQRATFRQIVVGLPGDAVTAGVS